MGTGTPLLVGLLVLALGFTAVLAYQAHDAAGSHRELARQTVADLAHAAAWQLSERGSLEMGALLQNRLIGGLGQAPARDGAAPPPLSRLVRSAGAWADCGCPEEETPTVPEPDTYFRLLLDDRGAGELEVDGRPLSPQTRAWLRDTLVAVSAEGTEAASRASERSPPVGITFRLREGAPPAAFVHYLWGPPGEPAAVYGFAVDAEELARSALGPVVASERLLPPTLTGELSSTDLFRVEIRGPSGETLLRSGAVAPNEGGSQDAGGLEGDGSTGVVAASVAFPSWLGGLEAAVAIPEDRAESLVIGGLPASRVPTILILLVLTGGLLAAAVVLLRREHQLARLRSDFVAGVTHELRTPLAQIRMFAELLSLGKLESPGDARRAVAVIDQESRRLDHLVDNVLGFARMAGPARSLRPEPADVGGLLEQVAERFRPLAAGRGVRVTVEASRGIVARVDEDAFHRIVLNLLDNAVKYGPRGQTVRMSAGRDGDRVRIRVDDEGPGVPAPERARIWEPYERLGNGSGPGATGSGIGLSLVKRLTASHGGEVRVDETPGGGARFELLLPLAPDAPDRAGRPTADAGAEAQAP